jgi:hypothetical protein
VSDLDAFEERLKTIETLLQGDFTVGQLTKLNERLNLAEGNILNLQMSHRSHVNYNPVEFANMHGYRIEWLKKRDDSPRHAICR